MLDFLCLTALMIAALRLHRLLAPSAHPLPGAIRAQTQRKVPHLPSRIVGRITLTLSAALLTLPAAAQRVPPADNTTYARAIAAGYVAATLCSGVFTAGRDEGEITGDELAGIYPEYQPILKSLTAAIEPGRVTVPFDPELPPREAHWTPDAGCLTEPIGWTASDEAIHVPPLTTSDRRPWPQGDAGIQPRPSVALTTAVNAAFDGSHYGAGKTIGVVVVHDGKVAAERYRTSPAPYTGWGPFVANRTWSVGKSISGTLVGLATAAGKADVAKAAPVPEWRMTPGDPRAAITLNQLLRMASGLHSGAAGNRTDAMYFGGTAVTEEATAWPLEAAPGTRFRYANDDVLLAVRSLRATLGETAYADFPTTALFRPLGMTHTVAGKDPRGNYILSSQVWSTARDLARLGQFWLQDGVWQGKRLLPEGWMRYMTTPSGPQPPESLGSGPGYGATMWLFGPKQGLPEGSYAAQGNRGQYVMVIPSARLVIVRRGEDPGAARFDIARFSADVLAATSGDSRPSPAQPTTR